MKRHLTLLLTLSPLYLATECPADALEFDFNDDGVVDIADANAAPDLAGLDGVLQCISASSADFNGDGTVNFSDFLVLSSNYNQSGRSFSNGDTNLDGKVDLFDFARHSILFNTSGYVPPPAVEILDAADLGLGYLVEDGVLALVNQSANPISILAQSVESSAAGLNANGAGPFTITLLNTPGQVDIGNLGNPFVLGAGATRETEVAVTTDQPLTVSWAIGDDIYVATRSLTELLAVRPPGIIRHQGRVAINGVNHDGPGFFKAALVGGNPAPETLWTNDGTALGNPGGEPTAAVPVTVSRGHYAFGLGDTSLANMTTEIAATLLESRNDLSLRLWFGTSENGRFTELTPAQPFASVPYALHAARASGVSAGAITTSMIAPGAITPEALRPDSVTAVAIAPRAITSTKLAFDSVTSSAIAPGAITLSDLDANSIGLWEVAGPDIFRSSGKVGIGTSGSPIEELEVRATAPSLRVAADNALASSVQLYEITNGNPFGFEFEYDGSPDKLFLHSRGFSGNEAVRMTWSKDGNVGIGTTSPTAPLEVAGAIRSSGASGGLFTAFNPTDQNTSVSLGWLKDTARIRIGGNGAGSRNGFDFQTVSDRSLMRLQDDGKIGIGTTSPSHLLHVNGVARSTQSTWATSSDARVKESIHSVEGSLARLTGLRPVTFEYTAEYRQGRGEGYDGQFTGFIAQEVKQVFPEMVTTTKEVVGDSALEDFHVLNSGDLVPHLVAAVQELRVENEALKEQQAATLERLAALERIVLGENCEDHQSR